MPTGPLFWGRVGVCMSVSVGKAPRLGKQSELLEIAWVLPLGRPEGGNDLA